MRVIIKKLRESARGRDCTLRLAGICNFDSETVVLAHLPCGMKGTGMKSPDNIAAFACSNCHDAIDGRSRNDVDGLDLIRALAETQAYWIEHGLMVVK